MCLHKKNARRQKSCGKKAAFLPSIWSAYIKPASKTLESKKLRQKREFYVSTRDQRQKRSFFAAAFLTLCVFYVSIMLALCAALRTKCVMCSNLRLASIMFLLSSYWNAGTSLISIAKWTFIKKLAGAGKNLMPYYVPFSILEHFSSIRF